MGNSLEDASSSLLQFFPASGSGSIMDSLFQRSLDDLIKCLRSPVASLPTLISKSMEEIRRELKSTDLWVKSVALQKLTYLSSIHFIDMSFASFHVVELMSSPHFHHKKLGYLGASLSFNQSTDVLLLVPNQLRKDLRSPNAYESSLALEFLSVAMTPDLAREVTPEIFTLLSSSKYFVRKKAIAALMKTYKNYPDAIGVTFKRLIENLQSSDATVVSAAVGVLCELSTKDPKSHLPLAPEFYRILTASRNNWVLIKLLKIFAKLIPTEQRLAKKVVEPICEIMTRTGAKSVAFEAVRTVISSLTEFEFAVKLAVEKIREFVIDDDPNLKYLGLRALTTLRGKHSWATLENKQIIVQSMGDADPNIKREALHLLMGMVSESNLEEISENLATYALKCDPEFCNDILEYVLTTCSENLYEKIVDFDWYVSLLGKISRNPHCRKGDQIERQIVDVGLRVRDARPQLVKVATDLLIDPALLGNPNLHMILAAAAWVSAEYIEHSQNPQELIEAFLQPQTELLPTFVRAIYIRSTFKALVSILHSYFHESVPTNCEGSVDCSDLVKRSDTSVMKLFTHDSIVHIINLIKMSLEPLVSSDEVELQERTRNVLGLIGKLEEMGYGQQNRKSAEMIKLVFEAFSEELGPVSVNAQRKVSPPDGIILLEDLSDMDALLEDDISLPSMLSLVGQRHREGDGTSGCEHSLESSYILAKHRQRHGLYYLSTAKDDGQFNEYPPANNDPLYEATEDLVKLTEQSLVTMKRNHNKPRPVVVKLGDEEEAKNLNDRLLSSEVQRTLLLNEASPSVTVTTQRSVKDKYLDTSILSKVPLNDAAVSTKKGKHKKHEKDRHRSFRNDVDKGNNKVKSSKQKNYQHSKGKIMHTAENELNMTTQSPLIQDLLL